jgi:hypothetical protein
MPATVDELYKVYGYHARLQKEVRPIRPETVKSLIIR